MNDFTFSPLTLSEVHRRRANRQPFFVDFTVPETVDSTKNEQEPEVLA